MTVDYENILRRALEKWGPMLQSMKAMEEAAEFGQAVSKMQLDPCEDNKENLTGEMADVIIMIKQMCYMHNISDKDIDDAMDFKMERLDKRIKKGDVKYEPRETESHD